MGKSDARHINKFGAIGLFKDTKYWFKRDIQTIKNAFFSTIKNSPFIFIATIIFSLIISSGFENTRNLENILRDTLIFFPISLLGYFMFYVMIKKGYSIDPYAGTHIDSPKHTNRFSVNYVLNPNVPKSRKIFFLLRFALYILMVIGLLLAVFQKFRLN